MKFRQFSVFLGMAIPALGLTQTISVYDSFYRLEADAHSGVSFDSQTAFGPLGAQQNFYNRVDAYASQGSSSVHSWASASWNCTATDLDVELVACWDSFDFGDGNSAHMLSRALIVLELDTLNIVSTAAAYDLPNSWAEIDIWNGSSWVLLVNRFQIINYVGVWNPGFYRLWAERHYDPVGNSTGCEPWEFNLNAQAVPEPASMLALSAGVALVLRRRQTVGKN